MLTELRTPSATWNQGASAGDNWASIKMARCDDRMIQPATRQAETRGGCITLCLNAQQASARPAAHLPECLHARVFSDVLVRRQHRQRVRLGERHEHPVERVAMDEREAGGGARHVRGERELA